MKVLITGSIGLVGRFAVRELQGRHDLVLTDMRPPDEPSPHTFLAGDLMDAGFCRRAVDGVDAVVHLAALLSPHIPRAYEINTVTTWNIADAARLTGVRRFLFASSINVYGQGSYKISSAVRTPPYLPIDENVEARPEDGYGLSKLAGEITLRGISDACGMCVYCFRLPGVWRPDGTASYRPRPLDKCPPLTPLRLIDPWLYIDVRDVAAAMRLALEAARPPLFAVSYLTAADTTRPEPTMDLLRRFIPEWLSLAGDRLPGHAPWFSSSRAFSDLGWRPRHTWRNAAARQSGDGSA